GEGGRGGLPGAQVAGAHGRPLGAHPYLQLPGEPDRRPPHRLQGAQPRRRAGWRNRAAARGPAGAGPGGQARRLRPVNSEPAYDVALAASARLAEAGLPSPGADARILLAHVLGVDVSQMLLAPRVTAAQRDALDVLLERRESGMPVQHLTGEAHF